MSARTPGSWKPSRLLPPVPAPAHPAADAHTPVPWFVVEPVYIDDVDGSQLAHIRTAVEGSRLPVAQAMGISARADAAFIVRACNAHAAQAALVAELVHALGALVTATDARAHDPDTLEDELDELLTHGDAIDQARAALAKAEA